MNFFSKKEDDKKPIEMSSFTSPAQGGGYSYSAYNPNGMGNVPRLNDQQNIYGQQNDTSQQQYDQQFVINNTKFTYQDPLMSDQSNLNNNFTYQTTIDDSKNNNQASQDNQGQSNYIGQFQELMKMEGRSPLCKAFTYINIILALLILYLIMKSF